MAEDKRLTGLAAELAAAQQQIQEEGGREHSDSRPDESMSDEIAAELSPTGGRGSDPIYDLATLEVVHDYYEFEAVDDQQMDNWLHLQILRARKGRELTAEEETAFLLPAVDDGSAATLAEAHRSDSEFEDLRSARREIHTLEKNLADAQSDIAAEIEERERQSALLQEQIRGLEMQLIARPTREQVQTVQALLDQQRQQVATLTTERDKAITVLAPNMPESGLVDACKQVKQVALAAMGNCRDLERVSGFCEAHTPTLSMPHACCPCCEAVEQSERAARFFALFETAGAELAALRLGLQQIEQAMRNSRCPPYAMVDEWADQIAVLRGRTPEA